MKKRIKAKKVKRLIKAPRKRKVVRKPPPGVVTAPTLPVTGAMSAPAPAPVEPPKPKLATIQINAKYLRAMRHIAANGDIRYYLNGVQFQTTKEGGKFYIATDGHRIAVIQEPWGSGEEPQDIDIVIPRAVAAAAKPLLKGSSNAILTQQDTWTWTLRGAGEIAAQFRAIDGKFPEWKKVVPSECSGKIGAFNWSYLHDFNLLAKEAFGRIFSVELQHNGGVVTSGSHSFVGFVMPMRMSEGVVPQWAVAIQKANAEKKAKAEAEKSAANENVIAKAA